MSNDIVRLTPPDVLDIEQCRHIFPRLVSLDIETTGINIGSRILTIGAITLDLKYSFYIKVNLDEDTRFQDEEDTLVWWTRLKRTDLAVWKEAWAESYTRYSLNESLYRLSKFLRDTNATGIVGDGVSFDNAILREAYIRAGVTLPSALADARKDFCYRTMKTVFSHIKPPKTTGPLHHALEDAIHHARHLNLILNSIASPSEEI
jgi:hypothetical protein